MRQVPTPTPKPVTQIPPKGRPHSPTAESDSAETSLLRVGLN